MLSFSDESVSSLDDSFPKAHGKEFLRFLIAEELLEELPTTSLPIELRNGLFELDLL